MIYAYDLLVNLNSEMYDFYDWVEEDAFTHIRKCPLIKVTDKDFINLCFKKIRVTSDFLDLIKDKCQVFKNSGVETITYACIFTNGINSSMVTFESSGFVLQRSKFLVSEELLINELSSKIKITYISYNVINKKCQFNKMLREEKEKISIILSELESIKNSKEKIDYLYYEWFGKKSSDNKYEELIKDIKFAYSNKHSEFLEILNLILVEK